MMGRGRIAVILIATGLLVPFHAWQAPTAKAQTDVAAKAKDTKTTIHYLEIVTNDVDALCATYERVHGLSFGSEDPDAGQARIAVRPDGGLVGIRKPLAEHDLPTVRTYLAVADIKKAVEEAVEAGAMLAYPPTEHGKWGTFAIVIQGDVQHGLWQR